MGDPFGDCAEIGCGQVSESRGGSGAVGDFESPQPVIASAASAAAAQASRARRGILFKK